MEEIVHEYKESYFFWRVGITVDLIMDRKTSGYKKRQHFLKKLTLLAKRAEKPKRDPLKDSYERFL